jgi:hypothetical protein
VPVIRLVERFKDLDVGLEERHDLSELLRIAADPGVVAGALGYCIDTSLQGVGVLAFDTGRVVPWLAPPWLIALWLQFATLLRFSLRWLDRRPALAGLLGLVGGPVAFLSGQRLGAVTFPAGTPIALAALGLVWAAVTPLLLAVAARLGTRTDERGYRGLTG